jgi:hypothetical protein
MIVNELIPSDQIVLLHGQPRDGKTWTAHEIGTAITTGTPAFGLPRFHVERPCRVLIIGNEDGERATAERLRLLLAGRGVSTAPDGIRLLINRGVSLDDPEWQERIIREIQRENISVVIVDPLRSVSAAVDKGPGDFNPLGTYLRRLVRSGATLVLVHHDTKPPANGIDTRRRAQKASGGGIFSISDAPIHVERIDERRTLLTPDGYKHSSDPAPCVLMRECGDGWIRIVGESTSGTSAADATLRAKVRDFLQHHPGAYGNKVVAGVGANKKAVIDALRAMAQADELDSVKERRGVRWFVRNAGGVT